MRFSNRKLLFCFCFYVAARETEKQKIDNGRKAPKTYKNSVFFKMVIQI